VLSVLILGPLANAFPATWSWTLKEFQPNVPQGGRANAIAVNPTNDDILFVASETGGVFRSSDRGVSWHHVDALPAYYMGSVAYVPADPNVLIATSGDQFTSNDENGGIWRSTNGGASWTHLSNPPPPPGVTARFSAGEISIAPDTGNIFVATNFGVSISTDRGVSWATTSPFGWGAVSSVLSQTGGLVLASNPGGVVRSTDGGASWNPAGAGPGGVGDMHGFGRSPLDPQTVYAVNSATKLFFSEDGGLNWTQIASAPAGGGSCGGIAFIKPVLQAHRLLPNPPPETLKLYFGNRCGLAILTAPQVPGTAHFDYGGAWVPATLDHGDTRDLAFGTRRLFKAPLLLGTDGGLHVTADGGLHWTFTGGGAGGYNALQITEVKSQWIEDVNRFDLYYGTQDNDLRASGTLGSSWINPVCCEGFFIEREARVAKAADSLITFVRCGACDNLQSAPLFASASGWPNPPGVVAGNPAVVSRDFVIQGVSTDTGLTKGFAVTPDRGSTWTQYATLPEDRGDQPKRSLQTFNVAHRHRSNLVHYQSIRTGFDAARNFGVMHLARLTKRLATMTASVSYPAMNGFGGFGINPTMFAWYQVFGVDPLDSSHLIAPDVINEKVMQTWDGGENWAEIPLLTSMVTDSGHYLFRNWVFPHVSAVSFYPSNPNLVALGTQQGGVFVSTDRGSTWSKVPGSERATYITSLEWRTGTDLFVSTYGRGLWRIQGKLEIPNFPQLCEIINCLIRYVDPGDPPPDIFKRGIAVLEGHITGVHVDGGIVKGIDVSPGSSIGYIGKGGEQQHVVIRESKRFVGLKGLVSPRLNFTAVGGGPHAVALALDVHNRLRAAAFSEESLPLAEPTRGREPEEATEDEPPMKPSRSPTADRPYVSVTAEGRNADAFYPGGRMTVSAQRMPYDVPFEVLLDGRVVEKVAASANGVINTAISTPDEVGLHTLTIRDAPTGKVIDGTMFIVRHLDRREDKDEGTPVSK
jgi:photosystem II stability/assembly factor-like uncharacterized protein